VLHLYKRLQRRREAIETVYFPTSGLISFVTTTEEGTTLEVAIVGREGMLGIPIVLGGETAFNDATVQIPGSGLRISASILRQEVQTNPQLRAILLRYVQASLNSARQSAACNSAHLLNQRLARWLLSARDRCGDDQLPLTHEFVAMMLGARRPGITVAAQSLQSAGLIRYARGRITIIDARGLRVAACECYGVIKREYARLLGPRNKMQAQRIGTRQ
jgi:CRP-like cAMP-binding protein